MGSALTVSVDEKQDQGSATRQDTAKSDFIMQLVIRQNMSRNVTRQSNMQRCIVSLHTHTQKRNAHTMSTFHFIIRIHCQNSHSESISNLPYVGPILRQLLLGLYCD